MPDLEIKLSQAIAGLNTDSVPSQIQEGQLTNALNAVVENFDGQQVSYQNEQSNELCWPIPEGFSLIGHENIVQQNRTLVMLTSPVIDEIGFITNCQYTRIVWGDLNFSVDYPIHKIEIKTTNCSTQAFWTDAFNPRRWVDFEDLPWREIPDPNNEFKKIKVVGDLDPNKLLVQPVYSIPQVIPTEVEVGADIEEGAYQFAVQYSNSLGEPATSYYGVTNPIGIFEDRTTQDFNTISTKAIQVSIYDLDTSGLYDYFNLAVIKTVNNITSVELVGTFAINSPTYSVVYTGQNKQGINVSISDIFERFPYYDIAGDLAAVDNSLIWAKLSTKQKKIYQSIWSNVRVDWETHKIPYNKFEGYNNPINTSEFKGYPRDEVVALEGMFIKINGEFTDSFHIPGRVGEFSDFEIIDNKDALQYNENACDNPESRRRWEVYNTASVIDFSDEYKASGTKDCYKGPYQYGKMGYWESAKKYPNNTLIWGNLAGKPIRHHKLPDCIVSPIHDNNTFNDPTFEHSIYPIGFKIDATSLYNAINQSNLTQAEKDEIVGFKIVRANRATNKSIVAKGLFYNVGKYTTEGRDYFYPNYPFNDLRPDPFISSVKVQDHSGDNAGIRLSGFTSNDSKKRYTFHSPDTHFYQPYGIDTGYVKMETVEYGTSQSHFIEVKEASKYKFLTKDALYIAFAAAMASIVSLDTGGGFLGVAPSAKIDAAPVPATFTAVLELLKNIAPFINYAYQFNSIGDYHSSLAVPNTGNKLRTIEEGSYIISSFGTVNRDRLNNFRRESSVYITLNDTLPFPNEIGAPQDNSRYTLSQVNQCDNPAFINQRSISSYYGAIKRVFPDQYGDMYSYDLVDTGYYHRLLSPGGNQYSSFPTVFGGDTFINRFALKRKHSFFIDYTVGLGEADGADIALNLLGNVGHPIYFYSTAPIDIDVNFDNLQQYIDVIVNANVGNLVLNGLTGGVRPLVAGIAIMYNIFSAYIQTLGVNNINLDCPGEKNLNETGKAYLFAYGIPYFFCESEVNVDYRRAINNKSGDFYPHVGEDIPDDWLQEINVPIIEDNSYIYNKTYSKQNKETSFTHLREDFDPTKECTYNFENLLIYSDRSSLEETKNNWLVYRPLSQFFLPKNYGQLTAIEALEDRQILARFENKSLLYNVLTTIDTTGQQAYIGNPNFFSAPPLDFAETDLGYNGTQHKLFIRTQYGHLSIDAERGQVFLFKGNGAEELSSSKYYNEKWFQRNLPFQIKKAFPQVNIDNAFKDIGLTAVFDNKYKRLIITKKDYKPIIDSLIFSNNNFYHNGQLVELSDTRYFCDQSWTRSFSLKTNSWVSPHSYIPNYYIAHPTYFQAGNKEGLWNHNKALTFCRFFGEQEDYTLEYPLNFAPNMEIIQSVSDSTRVFVYESEDVFYEVDDNIYFNEANIWNNQQSTGTLLLEPRPKGNMAAYRQYPKFNTDSKTILFTKSDNLFSFNTFWDVVKEPNKPFYTRPCNEASLDKIFDRNLDYSPRAFQKGRIRSQEARIRLTYNKSDKYKLVSNFILTQTQKSIK